jgi:hypothetical protein
MAVVLGAALALPAAAPAGKGTDGTLSVERGKGQITLKFKGTAVGRAFNGKIRIRDLRPLDAQVPTFRHCKKLRPVNRTTLLCTGKRISFRALDGRYVIMIKGTGIFESAVGRGTVTVDGTGENGKPDGLISFDDAPYDSLPDVSTVFQLGTNKNPKSPKH